MEYIIELLKRELMVNEISNRNAKNSLISLSNDEDWIGRELELAGQRGEMAAVAQRTALNIKELERAITLLEIDRMMPEIRKAIDESVFVVDNKFQLNQEKFQSHIDALSSSLKTQDL